jgi:hypothetical protein
VLDEEDLVAMTLAKVFAFAVPAATHYSSFKYFAKLRARLKEIAQKTKGPNARAAWLAAAKEVVDFWETGVDMTFDSVAQVRFPPLPPVHCSIY